MMAVRSIWAVARQTLLECFRSRLALALLAVLLVIILSLGLSMQDSTTLKSRLQAFLAYSSGLTQLLVGVATVLLGCRAVSGDVQNKTIFLVASKPLGRWHYILGRWLGLSLLNAVLLGAAFLAMDLLARHIRSCPTETETRIARGEQLDRRLDLDRHEVDNNLMAARVARNPQPYDLDAQVSAELERLDKEGGMELAIRYDIIQIIQARQGAQKRPVSVDDPEVEAAYQDQGVQASLRQKVIKDLRKRQQEQKQLVAPGQGLWLTFDHLPPSNEASGLELRYMLTPARTPKDETLRTGWMLRDPASGGSVPSPARTDPVKQVISMPLAPQAIGPDGTLRIQYFNLQGDTEVHLKSEDVTLLYRVGSFEGNMLRSALLTLVGMMFLAALSVMFSSFLSFPVACLVCMVALGVGYASDFLLEATRLPNYQAPQAYQVFCLAVVKGLLFFLPSFNQLSPSGRLVEGLVVEWREVIGQAAVWFGRPAEGSFWANLGFVPEYGAGLKMALALLIGCIIYQRRELAKVQV
jgi:hypothetical protein